MSASVQPSMVSRSIPLWAARTLEHTLRGLQVRHGQILESDHAARWDIRVELVDGTEVLAWVDREDQTPSGVETMVRQALLDSGVA